MATLQTRKRVFGQANPWSETFTLTIATDSGTSVIAPDFMFYSGAAVAASKLIELLELGNEAGLVVTIAQAA